MFLKIYKKAVEIILGAGLGFTEVKMYKGELEEGSEFRGSFPAAFLEFTDDIPFDQIAGDGSGDSLSQLEIYLCAKDTTEPLILDAVNQVVNLFNGTDIEIDGDIYKARYIRTVLHAYISGLGKAYKITIGIH